MITLQNISNFIKLGFKFFIFKLLFFNSLFSNNIEDFVENSKIYENSYWSKLLHYRDGESEIDSDNFFISKDGKNDLKKELFETIKSLENGTNNILCRFPLRVSWIKEQIPKLENSIKNYACEELDKYLELTNAKYVSLVFPTSHINSPASMYGHTFLRVSSDKNTPLISNAINYAAKTDEKNGLVFAYQGIFGGYEGRYSILPYYEKIKEYNNLEQRDVWEYDLNLNQDEIFKLVLHSWELKDSYADYYFFKENCSYAILWLLEIARPNLDLVNNFIFKAIPLDTIKLISKNSLIEKSNYRYSNMKKMKHILENKIEDKSYLKDFLEDKKELENSLSRSDKISYLDFKTTYLQYERAEGKLKKDKNSSLKLDSFSFLNIKSLASQDFIFKPISWGVEAKIARFNSELFFKLNPEAGVSYSFFDTIFYSNINSNILYKANKQYISAGASVGFVVNSFENIKFGSSFSYDKYNKEFENRVFETFTTYGLDRNLALNLNYTNDNLDEKQDSLKFVIFYYF